MRWQARLELRGTEEAGVGYKAREVMGADPWSRVVTYQVQPLSYRSEEPSQIS